MKKEAFFMGGIIAAVTGFLSPGLIAQCEQAALSPDVPIAYDHFGQGVAISGTAAVIGCPDHDDIGFSSGNAFVYRRTGRVWGVEQELTGLDTEESDYFGYSVAIDGDTIVVGAYGEDTVASEAGAAYVFRRTAGTWVQEAKLVAADGEINDYFGYSVGIDGDVIAVGALFGNSTPPSAGAVYVFRRSGTVWNQEDKLTSADSTTTDYFGNSVSISGDVIATGSHYTGGSYIGAAYVFRKAGATWPQEQRLLPSHPNAGAFFGFSLSVSGDLLVVGAFGDDEFGTNAGKAYVFRRSGAVWTEEDRVTASDAAPGDQFGSSVATTGVIVAVGANGGPGKGYEFRTKAGDWAEEFSYTASDVDATSAFGTSISADGDFVMVGAPQHDDPVNNVGGAYIFVVGDEIASFANYGAGWPGSLGIPYFTVDKPPVLGDTITLRIQNSLGALTFGFMMIGTKQASLPTNLGGTLLVLPTFIVPIFLPLAELDLPVLVPCNSNLLGLPIFCQAIQSDAAASDGFSFTPGLQLIPGY